MGLSASQARLMMMTSRLSDLELKAQQISNAKVRLADQSEDASRAYSEALDKQVLTVKSFSADGNYSYIQANLTNLISAGSSTLGIAGDTKLRMIQDNSGKSYITDTIYDRYNAASGTGDTKKANFISSCTGTAVSALNTTTEAYKYYAALFVKLNANQYIFVDTTQSTTAAPSGISTLSQTNATSPEWLQAQIEAGNIALYEYSSEGNDGSGGYEQVSWSSGDSSLVEKTDNSETAKAEAEYETATAKIKSKEQRLDLELKQIDTEHTAVQTEMESVKKVMDKNIERTFKIFDA